MIDEDHLDALTLNDLEMKDRMIFKSTLLRSIVDDVVTGLEPDLGALRSRSHAL